MNKLQITLATALAALSAGAFAQDADPNVARQQRMDAAYAESQRPTQVADSGVREDLHKTGHAIHQGVRATGHAIHRGVDAVTK